VLAELTADIPPAHRKLVEKYVSKVVTAMLEQLPPNADPAILRRSLEDYTTMLLLAMKELLDLTNRAETLLDYRSLVSDSCRRVQ